MTAPNIIGVVTITGKSVTGALGTSTASLLQNSASSNKVFKINTILVSNVDGTNSATAAISLYDCLLYTSPSPRDRTRSRMPSSA